MDFYKVFYELLYRQGYRPLLKDRLDYWYKRETDRIAMLHVLPERLAGQDPYSMERILEEQETLGSRTMLRMGQQPDWLVIRVFKEEPDEKTLREMAEYPDIWYINRKERHLLIYEKQRIRFYGLRDPLEAFLLQYGTAEKRQRFNEFRRIFTPVNTAIVAVNLLVYLILSWQGDVTNASFMADHGAMTWDLIVEQREYYRLFTSLFLHFGADHLLQNMLILILMGSRLERLTGRVKYPVIYLGAGLAGSVSSLFFTLRGQPFTVGAGASGAIFGVMGGILCLILKDMRTKKRRRIRDIGLSGVLFMICGAMSYGFMDTGIDNAAHLGGLIAGCILTGILVR